MMRDLDTAALALADLAQAASPATTERSVSNAALARFMAGDAAQADRVTRPFEQVGVVNRCIRMRGDALKSMPLMISTRDDELVEAGEVMDLINCPYPGLTTEDLVEWIDALVMLTGACYLIVEEVLGGAPVKARPVGAGTCRPKYDDEGELTHYLYRKPGARGKQEARLEPHEVIPFTLANYQTEKLHDGMAQLTPARRSIDQVYAADTANLESLYNGVEPGLCLTLARAPSRPTSSATRSTASSTTTTGARRGATARSSPAAGRPSMTLSRSSRKWSSPSSRACRSSMCVWRWVCRRWSRASAAKRAWATAKSSKKDTRSFGR